METYIKVECHTETLHGTQLYFVPHIHEDMLKEPTKCI